MSKFKKGQPVKIDEDQRTAGLSDTKLSRRGGYGKISKVNARGEPDLVEINGEVWGTNKLVAA